MNITEDTDLISSVVSSIFLDPFFKINQKLVILHKNDRFDWLTQTITTHASSGQLRAQLAIEQWREMRRWKIHSINSQRAPSNFN